MQTKLRPSTSICACDASVELASLPVDVAHRLKESFTSDVKQDMRPIVAKCQVPTNSVEKPPNPPPFFSFFFSDDAGGIGCDTLITVRMRNRLIWKGRIHNAVSVQLLTMEVCIVDGVFW